MGIFFVNNQIKQRVLDEALYIISTGKTLRATAKVFSVSKSTVHIDMSRRLKSLMLYAGVMYGIIAVMNTYEMGLLEEISISASTTGIIYAIAKKFALYKSWQNNVKSK